jgi:hypothetical protein
VPEGGNGAIGRDEQREDVESIVGLIAGECGPRLDVPSNIGEDVGVGPGPAIHERLTRQA